MLDISIHGGKLSNPIEALASYFRTGGVTIIQAAFAHSYFIHPDSVRAKPTYFCERARRSRKYYPRLDTGAEAIWPGDGRKVVLDYNQRAQMAWERYSGQPRAKRTGYSVRHIWGHPWNPDAYTAGWNLCYMPFWAGMLTEEQNPLEELEQAIRQASWDLYFRDNPVCQPPEFVQDPGLDLRFLLDGQPVKILHQLKAGRPRVSVSNPEESNALDVVKEIRSGTHSSWVNMHKASRKLQGKPYEAFGSQHVERKASSCVRRISRETGLTFEEIEILSATQNPNNYQDDIRS